MRHVGIPAIGLAVPFGAMDDADTIQPLNGPRSLRAGRRGGLLRPRRLRRQGRGRRLDAGRVPRRGAEVRRDARELRADGRPARARLDHARADPAPEARTDEQDPGRGRARAAPLPGCRGPRQAPAGDARGPPRREDEVPQRLPLPDALVGRRRDHRVARRRRRDRVPAGAARLLVRAVCANDAQDLLGGVGAHHARPRRRADA